MRTLLCLLLGLACLDCAAGDIYKCRNADGSTSFSDHPCASDAKTLSVPKSAQKDAPVNWLCDIEGARQDAMPDANALPQRQQAPTIAALVAARESGSTRSFVERGNVHLCTKPSGAPQSAPTASETVVTPEGHVWTRTGSKVQRLGAGEDSVGSTACISRITACMRPGDPKMESCVDNIPACGIGVIGACCSEDCLAGYRVSRQQGLPLADAVERMVTIPACTGVKP
jgi:hypothetical protein